MDKPIPKKERRLMPLIAISPDGKLVHQFMDNLEIKGVREIATCNSQPSLLWTYKL